VQKGKAERIGLAVIDAGWVEPDPPEVRRRQRQMGFLKLMRRMEQSTICQVIMATHSPMLMAYPNARLLRLSKYGLEPVTVEQTDHYKVMREFCNDPAGLWKRWWRSERSVAASPLLCRNRRQLKHSTVFGGLRNVAATQGQPHRIELARIVGRKIRRPCSIVLDQIDGDLGGILALVDELFDLRIIVSSSS
jgi:hypothetical protein